MKGSLSMSGKGKNNTITSRASTNQTQTLDKKAGSISMDII